MEFMVCGYDGKDEGAADRRLAAREAHLNLIETLRQEKKVLYGAALLSDAGEMIGSVIIAEYPDRAALDEWLAVEPYVTGNVWQTVEITPCKTPPRFKS